MYVNILNDMICEWDLTLYVDTCYEYDLGAWFVYHICWDILCIWIVSKSYLAYMLKVDDGGICGRI